MGVNVQEAGIRGLVGKSGLLGTERQIDCLGLGKSRWRQIDLHSQTPDQSKS